MRAGHAGGMADELASDGTVQAGVESTDASPVQGPPSIVDVAWVAAITATKATVIALAVDAFANSTKPA